ncbi:MAG: LysE family translocator [Candidatus Thiodiazotropha lotti]|uniref:LysE family translocator n=1 Tax=Candidatus Thiodiazotropha endoloripes TaxID=1818881 RepID=UPI00083D2A74|nr:LysE family translocator [Candidatus Thiodiazotropha endoloripes]MCG7899349.1 LysE family translocator [Candidatus Thiodiazotropha weberae]MCG7992037.1 LysE family translocator [Candidatus Thiodiazotropha lotti]MCG7904670.1 LysE family translocator [Candidatus Thiodiazotropha weberae]MCG7915873.1 LysE family translocator [Candidatus Thiodiazotropha weberae]MCG7998541.1 LysE family translocator [Candidatus Thiodiazotropha lotti]
MISLTTAYAFITVSFVLCLAPGPDNIFVLTQSALYGRVKGYLVTLGLCTGLIVHSLVVALGFAALLKTSPIAITLLKVIGAGYLSYLGWLSLNAAQNSLTSSESVSLSPLQLYRRGIIMNVTNPKVTIFFLAFLPQFTNPQQGQAAQQIMLLGSLFILITFVTFGVIAFLAGSLGSWLNQSPKAQQYLNRMAGLVFIALALNLLFSDIG